MSISPLARDTKEIFYLKGKLQLPEKIIGEKGYLGLSNTGTLTSSRTDQDYVHPSQRHPSHWKVERWLF